MSLTGRHWQANRAGWLRGLRSAALALAFILVAGAVLAPAEAAAETRTLKLYFTHTGERAEITFKRNGRYVRSGLNKLNRFLRDHRRNEPTNMDPELFDLVWEVYRASGARDYIHVVSAYRSPATNAMLRRTRGGQARKSQHTLGRAMDFFIPGVSTRKLRELGFKLQGGGVGYYPKSATPFVHLDTGNVRAWPRMSRSELTRLFPDGKTLHLPPDGRRLPGYQQALAAYNARERSGQPPTFGRTRRSSGGGGGNERGSSGGGGGNLLANLFGRDRDDSASESASRPSAPARRQATPETPGTVLAALSRRSLPRPGAAPRAVAQPPAPAPAPAVVAPAPAAIAPAPAAAPQAPDTPPAATSTVGLRIPVPRALIPGVRVGDRAPAQPPAAAPQAPAPAAAPAPTPAPVQPDGPATLLAVLTPPVPRDRPAIAGLPSGDEAVALLAAAEAEPAPPADDTPTLLAALPSPSPRPAEVPRADDPLTQLAAYAPVEPMVPPTAPAPAIRPAAAPSDDDATGRGGRIAVPAPRPEAADRDAIVAAALDTGVTTTTKSARPSARDAVSVQPPTVPVVPADQIDPARFGDWTVSVASVTEEGRPTERPEFLRNATRTAPDAVYTAGFSKAPPPDPSRLTGNAVTFLAVARFDGGQGGGDGQPLQLQIPATN